MWGTGTRILQSLALLGTGKITIVGGYIVETSYLNIHAFLYEDLLSYPYSNYDPIRLCLS